MLETPRLTLLITVVTAMSLIGCQSAEPPADERVITYGHGAFLGEGGKVITADLGMVQRTQKDFLETLRRQSLEKGGLDIDGPRKVITSQVEDEVLANALYIDWLNDTLRPEDFTRIRSLNGALRMHYLKRMSTSKVGRDEQHETKGVGADVARKLEAQGIKTFSITENSGEAYIRECAAAGVPIPPPMFSAGWVNRGVIEDEFISTTEKAELMHYTSDKPPGVCLALPRYLRDDKSIDLLGIICLGTLSNKACFWDNPASKTFIRGVQVDIKDFVGGYALEANDQGTCSDCHAGENPFVVHPEKPPFIGLDLFGTGWYEPIVHQDWPQNPGPSYLLEAVSSEGRCDSCHRAGGSGRRFPALSKELPGYCAIVLETAVSPPLPGTMPPYGADRSQFTAHVDALRKACKAPKPTGTTVPGNIPDDTGYLSPPVVIDPLYGCATQVAVRGAVLDAKVTLTINGTDVGSLIARSPNHEVFNVPALVAGDKVSARQESGAAVSGPSPEIKVRDHKVDFPTGLPAPAIDPTLIYECAEVISVRHVPGAKLTVTVNGGSAVSSSTSTDWTAIRPGKTPFVVGDEYKAVISLCGDKSPESAPQKAVKAPANIPAPSFDPPQTFAGQQLVSLGSLTNGARTSIDVLGVGSAGGFSTPISWFPDYDFATPLGRALNSGEVLVAQQKLCDAGPTNQTPPAGSCKELPAPRILQPLAGTNFVIVSQAVPGARIRVYDSTNKEIGDGSGNVILLSRDLVATDILTVVQQVGKCTSGTAYRISVRGG
ncbi:hypothetical protein [Myxococcus sp. CA039A]|uniref:hypothetical protein n=1 Tax=Myxococcus sp. CA039A TaxID=2741737 RepID=UPI00157B2A84|nr:hypothetical protein [Myxococcus sp. CA039A]NTX53512.1 hypothetical protein [Myxococcus sp. CA039A]